MNPDAVLEVTNSKRKAAQERFDVLETGLSNWLDRTEGALELQVRVGDFYMWIVVSSAF